jgi:type V secretory pathway adhesin AidA
MKKVLTVAAVVVGLLGASDVFGQGGNIVFRLTNGVALAVGGVTNVAPSYTGDGVQGPVLDTRTGSNVVFQVTGTACADGTTNRVFFAFSPAITPTNYDVGWQPLTVVGVPVASTNGAQTLGLTCAMTNVNMLTFPYWRLRWVSNGSWSTASNVVLRAWVRQ